MNISMRFAVDRNKTKTIDKDEIISKLEELKAQDQDGNGVLEKKELNDVYFEYGEDQWLSGNRQHRLQGDGYITKVKLNQVKFDPARIDLKVDISM